MQYNSEVSGAGATASNDNNQSATPPVRSTECSATVNKPMISFELWLQLKAVEELAEELDRRYAESQRAESPNDKSSNPASPNPNLKSKPDNDRPERPER